MSIVKIHDAKTNLSKLINQVIDGEEVIITRHGIPLLRLIPYVKNMTKRKGGQLKGMITIAEDFDESSDYVSNQFLGTELR